MEKMCSSPPKKVVDTTGCGDVFCAATVAKIVEGNDPFPAAFFGIQRAAQTASRKGI